MRLDTKQHGDATIFTPVGRIDHASAESFGRTLDDLVAGCRSAGERLILDLAQVEYMSSLGLRALWRAAERCATGGSHLVVANLQPVVREIFEISALDQHVSVYASLEAALAAATPR
jgi:anti-anti-sigma factor